MSSNTTYYVDINSQYRDLEKYPNPADFAISFSTNNSTGYFPQGLPLSPSGYFQQASIDPDFNNNDLQFLNPYPLQYQRVGNSIFIAGSYDSYNPYIYGELDYSLKYKGQTLFAFPPNFTNFNTQTYSYSSFIMRIDEVDNLEMPYEVSWFVYTLNKNIYTNLGFGHSFFQITHDGNIYWRILSQVSFDLVVQRKDGNTYTLYENVNPTIYDAGQEIARNNWNNVIFYITQDGELALFNGHNWGYHLICSKETKIAAASATIPLADDSRYTFSIDRGNNLYLPITLSPYNQNVCMMRNNRVSYTSWENYPRGMYTSTGLNGAPLVFSQSWWPTNVNPSRATGSFYVMWDNPTGINLLTRENHYKPPNITSIGYCDFCETSSNIYGVVNYFTSYTGDGGSGPVINNDIPHAYFIYNKTGLQFDLLTTTLSNSYNGLMYPHSIQYNNSVYTFGRASLTGTDNTSPIYAYKLNTTTNTVSKVATVSLTGSENPTSKIISFIQSGYIYVICTDFDYFNQYNDQNGNGYVLRFDPATNSFINYSQFETLSKSTSYQQIFDANGILCWGVSYNASPYVDVFDITDLTNIKLAYEFTLSNNCTVCPSIISDGITTNYILTISDVNTSNIAGYIINDIYNPSVILPRNTLYPSTYVNNEGKSYCSKYIAFGTNPQMGTGALGTFARGTVMLETVIYPKDGANFDSIHYNINTSNTLQSPSGALCIDIFEYPYELSQIIISANAEIFNIYLFKSISNVSLYSSFSVSYSVVPTIIKSVLYNDIQYICVCYNDKCEIYTTPVLSSLNIEYLETITFNLGDIKDINLDVYNNNLYIIMYNATNNLNIYQYTEGFNLISTLDFNVDPTYTVFSSSTITNTDIFSAGVKLHVIVAFSNSNPLIVTSLTAVIDISDPSNPSVYYSNNLYNTAPPTYKGLYVNPNDTFGYINTYAGGPSPGVANTNIFTIFFQYSRFIYIPLEDFYNNYCITTVANNNTFYIYNNRNNLGDDFDRISCYYYKSNSPTIVNMFFYTVKLNGRCLDLKSINKDNITLVSLTNKNTLYLYDVTDPEYAGKYQELTSVQQNYSNSSILNTYQNSCLHRIDSDGTPNWTTFLGSSFNQGSNLGYNNVIICSDIDNNGQYLYISGVFSRQLQQFNYTSTGYYISNQISNYTNGNNTDSFIMKLDTTKGNCQWLLPLLGNNITYSTNIKYSTTDSTIVFCGYSTSDEYFVYQIQGAGSKINPSLFQKAIGTTSYGSGFLTKINTNGTLIWNNILYSDEQSVQVLVNLLNIDSSNIYVVGTSNSNIMRSLDNNGNISQALYTDTEKINQPFIFIYGFNSNGNYIQSNKIIVSPNDTIYIQCLAINSIENQIVPMFYIFPPINDENNFMDIYNKDGTFAYNKSNIPTFYNTNTFLPIFYYNSTYYDNNGLPYSQIVFNENSPYTFTGSYFENYSIFIGGSSGSTGINKSFTIRDNFTGANNNQTIILNTYINIASLDRRFNYINDIEGTENHYITNISKSPLTSIVEWREGGGYPNPTTNKLKIYYSYSSFDVNKFYYLTYPINNGIEIINKVVPVLNIQPLTYGEYLFTLESVADFLSPTGIAVNEHYLYLSAFNSSLFYNLQFFPGSIAQPVYYNVRLQSMTIPNRPLINLEEYGGNLNFNDIPFLYLSLYNVDDDDNYDDQVVNVVYDSTPISTKPYPIFQIPITNPGTLNNFVTLSSDIQPVVKFSPGYYNIRVRLLDMNGNPIQFDTSATKTTDSRFNGGILPTYLSNVYLRLAFTKR